MSYVGTPYSPHEYTRTPGEVLDDCMRRACQYLEKPKQERVLMPRDLSFAAWMQEWNDRNMNGYSHSAGAQVEHEGKFYDQTSVIFGPCGDAVVFFGQSYGYHIKEPNELFWQLFNERKMLGSTDGWSKLEGRPTPTVCVGPEEDDWSMYGG
jgi:hypothetical protein